MDEKLKKLETVTPHDRIRVAIAQMHNFLVAPPTIPEIRDRMGVWPAKTIIALLAMVKKDVEKMAEKCNWNESAGGEYWQTDCGKQVVITDGTPAENGMRYCYHCGKQLDGKRYEEENANGN
jgi:hypothetical protein